MAGPEDERDPDLDAAERAVGTMPRAGEGLGEARRRRAWEARLAPLAGLVAPVPPPDGLLARILQRIDSETADAALARERRRAARWRGATLATGLAAAAAIAVAVILPRETAPELVSVVTAGAGAPALVVSLDPGTGRATVRPLALEPPIAGAFELWLIPAGGAPVSLGLVDPGTAMQVTLNAAPGDLVAVSLEPAGGSPTGQPTGPVVYSGAFVALR